MTIEPSTTPNGSESPDSTTVSEPSALPTESETTATLPEPSAALIDESGKESVERAASGSTDSHNTEPASEDEMLSESQVPVVDQQHESKSSDTDDVSHDTVAPKDTATRHTSVPSKVSVPGESGRAKALAHKQVKREEHLRSILDLARHTDYIQNDDIAKHVRVSDRTAIRYANLLVLRGKLFRTGKGRSIRYSLPN